VQTKEKEIIKNEAKIQEDIVVALGGSAVERFEQALTD
jgi:shikimate kinase